MRPCLSAPTASKRSRLRVDQPEHDAALEDAIAANIFLLVTSPPAPALAAAALSWPWLPDSVSILSFPPSVSPLVVACSPQGTEHAAQAPNGTSSMPLDGVACWQWRLLYRGGARAPTARSEKSSVHLHGAPAHLRWYPGLVQLWHWNALRSVPPFPLSYNCNDSFRMV